MIYMNIDIDIDIDIDIVYKEWDIDIDMAQSSVINVLVLDLLVPLYQTFLSLYSDVLVSNLPVPLLRARS
mgnify:CR=1 FL=1